MWRADEGERSEWSIPYPSLVPKNDMYHIRSYYKDDTFVVHFKDNTCGVQMKGTLLSYYSLVLKNNMHDIRSYYKDDTFVRVACR
jgi:hypothetical protein